MKNMNNIFSHSGHLIILDDKALMNDNIVPLHYALNPQTLMRNWLRISSENGVLTGISKYHYC